tara:strand:+ start:11778 stop:12587 length:810 start_codon:yes stop_codon:yes gene_type:complete
MRRAKKFINSVIKCDTPEQQLCLFDELRSSAHYEKYKDMTSDTPRDVKAYHQLLNYVFSNAYMSTVNGRRKVFEAQEGEDRLSVIELRVPTNRFFCIDGDYQPSFEIIKCTSTLKHYIFKKYERAMFDKWLKLKNTLLSLEIDSEEVHSEARLKYETNLHDEQHLYFIRDRSIDAIKIGISSNIKRRYRTLKRKHGEHLKVEVVVHNAGKDIEELLHQKFEPTNVQYHGVNDRGIEWFKSSEQLENMISTLKSELHKGKFLTSLLGCKL